jgi:hypothetical protein
MAARFRNHVARGQHPDVGWNHGGSTLIPPLTWRYSGRVVRIQPQDGPEFEEKTTPKI